MSSTEYYQTHKGELRLKANAYVAKRRENDENYKANRKNRAAVYNSFNRIKKGKPAKTEVLLGCTCGEAKAHIESLWTEGITGITTHQKGGTSITFAL